MTQVKYCVGIILSLLTAVAQATYISVDAIPGGGVDSSVDVNQGDSFAVDVLIGDVSDLAGFQFTLGFDAAVLTATGITSGDLFGSDTIPIYDQVGSDFVTFAETTLSFSGLEIIGPSVLATISFEADSAGISALSLRDVVLSDSLALEITPVTLNDGSASVRGFGVPEPGVLGLILGGIFLMGWLRSFPYRI